jgi:hypothetical protein
VRYFHPILQEVRSVSLARERRELWIKGMWAGVYGTGLKAVECGGKRPTHALQATFQLKATGCFHVLEVKGMSAKVKAVR